MRVSPLRVQCPTCGASDITYTCEPKCCFNHICGVCYTTFELYTEALARPLASALEKPDTERDCLAPTVACVKCGHVDVYMVEPEEGSQSVLVCGECRALLRCYVANVESR